MFDETIGSQFSSNGHAENNGETHDRPAFTHSTSHTPSRAGNGASKSADIASQADVLLELIDELKSITDRACDAAVRESECAERIEETKANELARLKVQLKEKEDALAARDVALIEQGEVAKTKIRALETELQERQAELTVRSLEIQEIKTNLQTMTARLENAESKAQDVDTRLHAELADVRRQLQETQTELRAKEDQLKEAGGDLKARNEDLELRLQEMEREIQNREAEIKEKGNLLEAAAARETEIGKLITRLSEECGKLSTELHEKSLIVAQLEKKHRPFIGDGAVWKKMLGRMKEEAL